MYKSALVVLCLVCTSHGRRVAQPATEDKPGEALVRFLLALDPAAAFSPQAPGAHFAVGDASSAVPLPISSHRQSIPAMSGAAGEASRRDALAVALAGLAAIAQPIAALAAEVGKPVKDSPYLTNNFKPFELPETVVDIDPGFIPGQKARQRSFEAFDEKSKRRPKPPKKMSKLELVVLILRVKEATSQEVRLITTGKYKTLQRLNVKLAIRFMLDNYKLQDRFNEASQFAVAEDVPDKAVKQQMALNAGRKCVDSLTDLSQNAADLVANALSPEEKQFILTRLDRVSKNIDKFTEFLPQELLVQADEQIKEENRLNAEEYPKDEEMLNVDKAVDLKGGRSQL
mmetsp:Transcript_89465/g.164119  ORF Transcript_89465/g.164119 Transcript_89465/m.164119 type:complete len:343 (-) Transcript_89465:173-1201(-)